MEGAGAIHSTKSQKQTLVGNEKINQQDDDDPKKFNYHLLYKASILIIFFLILPLFPSEPPQFINQSLLTRNWELLHLLFVGIAISYGLFSRRNHETDDKDNKFDTAQSLVSRFLQVSSFFEEEEEKELAENPLEAEVETKVETWSSQHIRNKPVVVMAPQGGQHFEEEEQQDHLHSDNKPLLLPVRSLKSRLSDHDHDHAPVQSVDGGGVSYNRRRSFSGKSKDSHNLVLPSPIPWKSRSARIMITEPKLQVELDNNSVYQQSDQFNTKVESQLMKSQSQSQSQSQSHSQTSRNSSSSSLSRLESLAKNAEDSVKKKSFYNSCPPPPPPPPPPTMFHKSVSMKPPIPRYDSVSDKEFKRSFTNSSSMMKKRSVGLFSRDREIGKELGMDDEEEHSISMQETKKTGKKNIMESEDEEETESEDEGEVVGEGGSEKENEREESSKSGVCNSVGDEGTPDVDKKADEFIAKFREQIRLQRIDSIKRSTTSRINSR